MSIYYFECEKGHVIALEMEGEEAQKTLKKIARGKNVCPTCNVQEPPVHSRMRQIEEPEHGGWYDRTVRFACRHGHITEINPFTSGMMNISWVDENGEDVYYNIKATPEDIDDMLSSGEIKCKHNKKSEKTGRVSECNCKMKKVDSATLEIPTYTVGFKTKTRVGDIWDKAGCPEPRKGSYDANGDYKETEFERRARKRVNDMREGTIEVFDDKTGRHKKIRRQRNNDPRGRVLNRKSKRKI